MKIDFFFVIIFTIRSGSVNIKNELNDEEELEVIDIDDDIEEEEEAVE